MNVEENINYLLLSIVKFSNKSKANYIVIDFDNNIGSWALIEIIKNNKRKINKNVIIECDFDQFENVFKDYLNEEEKEFFTFRDYKLFTNKNITQDEYRISGKTKTEFFAKMDFNYTINNFYPFYHCSYKDLEEILEYYNFSKKFVIENEIIKYLEMYFYDYEKFVELDSSYKNNILKMIKKQKSLETKFLPTLKELKQFENNSDLL